MAWETDQLKRPGFNSKRVVMVQAHYENGHYVPPVYIGDRSLKSPVSARDHIANGWKTLNKPREFYIGASRGVKVLLLLMLIVGGLLGFDQAAKGTGIHGPFGSSPLDPITPLWYDGIATKNLAGWNIRDATQASFCYSIIGGCNELTGSNGALVLKANATYSGVAIEKQPMDLSTSASKALRFYLNWQFNNTAGCCPNSWGFFLTRNNTIPSENHMYDPAHDRNVALAVYVNPAGGGTTFAVTTYLQRDPVVSIVDGNAGGCSGQGTSYMCGPAVASTVDTNTVKSLVIELAYNVTSTTSTLSGEYYWNPALGAGPYCCPQQVTNFVLPWFNFQVQQYYWGFFNTAASGANPIDFGDSREPPNSGPAVANSLLSAIYIAPPSSGIVPPPYVDTGGFFGPVIKALISIGIFILASIAQFFGYVYTAFVNGLDAVGNFLGLGAIGSAFAGALKGFADWIINIFGTIFLQSLNFVNFITSGLTLMINGVSNYWAGATAFIAQLVDLLSQGWTFVTSTLKFGNLGIKWLVVVWLVWGILASADSIPGFMNWFTISMLLTVRLFHGLYWIGDQAFLTVLRAKQLIAQWL